MIMEGQVTGMPQSDSQPLLWMTVGRSVLKKFNRTTWCSEWMPHQEKFSEKSIRAFSSRNRMWEGVESEVDAPERKGFRDGVDFRLGAIEQLPKERERERHAEKHQTVYYQMIGKKFCTYVWKMHEHVACNIKSIMSSAQSIPTSTQHFNIVITQLKCMNIVKIAHVMQCTMI